MKKPRLSAYDLQKAIMEFFTENKLYSTKGLFRHPSSAGKKTCFFSGLQDHLAGRSDGSLKEADSDDDPSFEIH